MGEGNIFSLCVSSHLEGGTYLPGRGVPPSQVWTGGYLPSEAGGGVPTFWVGGTPFPGLDGAVPTLVGGTYLGRGYLLGQGVPTLAGGYLPWQGIPTLVGGTYLGRGWYLPWQGVPTLAGGVPTLAGGTYLARGGTYLPRQGGYPLLQQHSVCLLRGGRYASCVHAGGLSCYSIFQKSRWI